MNETFIKNLDNILTIAREMMLERQFEIQQKDTKENICTSKDLQIQEFLHSNLTKLLPNSSFLGEENICDFKEGEYVWIVDPIDGTTNYSRDIKDCAISIALEHKSEIILGVVYLPFTQEKFYAEKGKGAFLNGIQIHASNKSFENGLFCTALCVYKKSLADDCLNILKDVYSKCADFRRFGSAAAELCYLAAGRCDLYFEIRLFPWDFAASSIILKEAGCEFISLNSNNPSLRTTSPFIAANNKENLDKLANIVQKYIKEIPYID